MFMFVVFKVHHIKSTNIYQDLVCAWLLALLFIDLSDGIFEFLQLFLFIMSLII